ncbi:hypothetical protein SAMN05444007_10764 [Cribrihabitans marinus]|uniref:Uncharacterized protein n=1 Tax=Cribrihabitans marinus TaxID=1227549 RepID=A0A1H7BIG5_9RHOB|nr:hypothetical protein [Cribrihabitans marinus]GGH34416.1 hypothetical protein GCM10010973_27100 [Cribrihabitans marinus]SEJ77421.1 hypothetical protein SAMN05444007_10764 [Cribrihabitans marinus]
MKLRMTGLATAAFLALSACDQMPDLTRPLYEEYPSKTVTVYSRYWAVRQVSDAPVIYRATRDWNNLNPYGRPARLRTTQAIAAIQKATGCRVIRSSMYQNISGQVFSQVAC